MVRLQAVVIGNAASMLNGAPVTTQDIDLLIRDTKLNRRKLARFAAEIGAAAPRPISELSNVHSIGVAPFGNWMTSPVGVKTKISSW